MSLSSSASPFNFNYQIKRSRRKTVAIHVESDQVEIRAPMTTPKWFIDEFILEKQSWINNKLAEQEQKQQEVYRIEQGATLPYLGANLSIEIEMAKRNSAKLTNDKLVLKISENTAEQKVKLMDRWLLKQAKVELPELVTIFAQDMGIAHKLESVKFRKTKSKWGHCTASGVIQLNPLILLAPESVVNYLIVHELCHLEYQNHSKAYWAMVKQYEPKYKDSEKWLKQQGHKLWYC